MRLREGQASRLTLYLHADASWHHHSVSEEVVQRALNAGLSGASVFHGIEGYGRSGVVHTSMLADVMEDLPCALVILDASEKRLRSFLSDLADVFHGVAVLDNVEVARNFGDRRADAGRGR